MKKKILTLVCVSMMTLSLAGCGKEKEDKNEKETTQSITTANEINLSDLLTTEATETHTETPSEEPVMEVSETEEGWITVGSDRTGYTELPSDWEKHESETEGGKKYSIQYLAPDEDGLVSLIDSDYDFDENQYDVDDPADIVTQAYIEQYGSMGAVHEGTQTAVMDGIEFYKTVDVLPEGNYKDYEYVLYTYVAYFDERFYTVIVEGERSRVEEISERVETTFCLTEKLNSSNDVDTNDNNDIIDNEGVTGAEDTNSNGDLEGDVVEGKTDWETYYANVAGHDYIIPCDFSEFEANGWVLDESCAGETIEYEDYTYAFIDNGDKEFYVVVANKNSETPIPIEDGQVIGVVFDFHSENMPGNIEGGICLGTSYDTVIEAFGTPDDVYEDEGDYKQITYFGATMSTDMYTKLEMIIESGIVTKIEMVHW